MRVVLGVAAFAAGAVAFLPPPRRNGGAATLRREPLCVQMQSIAPVRPIDPGARPPPSAETAAAERAPRSPDARLVRPARAPLAERARPI
ncbi:MAG TPA: hypothetical protein VGY54_11655 [Polyangiaceae bacterium]|jgi:hypothetical protein|nr:hypothetical protein [Polyangiaceae bacterium]